MNSSFQKIDGKKIPNIVRAFVYKIILSILHVYTRSGLGARLCLNLKCKKNSQDSGAGSLKRPQNHSSKFLASPLAISDQVPV